MLSLCYNNECLYDLQQVWKSLPLLCVTFRGLLSYTDVGILRMSHACQFTAKESFLFLYELNAFQGGTHTEDIESAFIVFL